MESTPTHTTKVTLVNSRSLDRKKDRIMLIEPDTPVLMVIEFVIASYPDLTLCQRVVQLIVSRRNAGSRFVTIA